MDRSTPIILITEDFEANDYGQLIPTESSRMVYAQVDSVTRSEFFEGGRNGLNPELVFRVFAPDYHYESIVEYDGKRYAIYRTYRARNEIIELYAERKGGVVNAPNQGSTT